MARCICCKSELNNITDEELGLQPVGGLSFETHGHYGTTIFDPMDSSMLAIVVCDDCVTRAAHEGDVMHKAAGQNKWKSWDPDKEIPED